VISHEYPPGSRDGRERCDFCTVRSNRLAGATDYPLDRTLRVAAVEVRPVELFGISGAAVSVRPVTIDPGIWAACAVCAPVVARRDPDALASHVLGEWVAAGQPVSPTDLFEVQSFYRALLPALGPPRTPPPSIRM
jgi:hypothetical protein